MSGTDFPTLDAVQQECTIARLKHFGGNKTRTAKSLGISLKTLYLRLDRYRIREPDFRKKKAARMHEASASSRAEKIRTKAEAKRRSIYLLRSRVSRAVRDLIDAPLAKAVPMDADDKRITAKPKRLKRRSDRYHGANNPMARWLETRPCP